MELAPKFGEVSSAISMALENVNKWYVNESDAYFICLSIPSDIVFVVQSCDWLTILAAALDPSVKLAYIEDKWDQEAQEDAIARLEAVVHFQC